MTTKAKTNPQYVKNICNAPPFSIKDKIGYMLGDLGFNTLQVLVNTYLMLFCVNVLGIESVHFAGIVFACRATDALNDTFIGRIVDIKPASKHGKFKPYILWFLIPYIVFTGVLFTNVSSMSYMMKIVWVFGIYFIWAVVGTFINVPYGAMSNIITTDQVHRTELSSFRSVGSIVGILVTTILAPQILFDENNNPVAENFILLSVILGAFAAVCMVLTHVLVHERVLITADSNVSAAGEKINYLQVAKGFLKNRIMIAVVAAYVVSKLFVQTTSTLNQYVYMTYYQDTSMLSLSSLVTVIPMVIGAVILKPMVNKFGKKNLVTWPLLGSAAMYAVTMFCPVSALGYILCQMVASFFSIFAVLLVWSLIADAVDYQAYLTGVRNDGTVYATITFIIFFAGSASTSLIALALEAVGYDAALGSAGQLAGVPEAIKMLGGFWPLLGSVLTFVCYKFLYNLSDERMAEISETLRQRAVEAGKNL